ncbi:MAG: diguanylate cyclase [Polyangiaceae bacterium]
MLASAALQISSKITLSISLVVALAGAIATGAALEGQANEQRMAFTRTNTEALDLLALSVAPAVAAGHHYEVQATVDNMVTFKERFEGIDDFEVIDMNGRIVAAHDPRRFGEVLTDTKTSAQLREPKSTTERTAQHLVVTLPIRLEHPIGMLRAHIGLNRFNASVRRQQSGAALLLAITMLLIGVSLHFLHGRLVGKRLSALAQTAVTFGKGTLATRADTTGSDEISELAGSFNKMASELEIYTHDLEHLVTERTAQLEEANVELERLATTDQLTGLCNRRHFDQSARRAIEVAQRNDRPLSVVLIDTDRFKSINDRFGHPAGDIILRDVARVLTENARKADLVARIGGEEFAVLMPEASEELAAQGAERMRRALHDAKHPDAPDLGDEPVTASFGVAALDDSLSSLDQLLFASDSAMYKSKTDGRNRVTVASAIEGSA